MKKQFDSSQFVKLSRYELDYEGWWNKNTVLPITRHISLRMGKSNFLERCKDLNSLIVEGLNESNLRSVLSSIGVDTDSIKGLRALKLLDDLVQRAIISRESGLRIVSDSKEIQTRLLEKRAAKKGAGHLETPIDVLFALYDLRLVAAHAGPDIATPLRTLGIDPSSVEAGWGAALDRLYDEIGSALEGTTEVFEEVGPSA